MQLSIKNQLWKPISTSADVGWRACFLLETKQYDLTSKETVAIGLKATICNDIRWNRVDLF